MKIKKSQRIYFGLVIAILISLVVYFGKNMRPQVDDLQIKLFMHEQNKVVAMDLEEYVKGTVAAEMPASFEMEALKAQAVCARTYAIKKLLTKSTYPQGADLSDDTNSCQAFVAQDNFSLGDPSSRNELWQKINEAVESTRSEIMLFDSQPIDALYCSTCGGNTEDAGEVWGSNISYLQSVKCGYCKESNHYSDQITLANSLINRVVESSGQKLKIKVDTRTKGGRPKTFLINGIAVNATVLRKELNLPSSWIEFKVSSTTTLVTTHGYGHGVGLCQYGANGMAQAGKEYQQILKKYYQGITIYKLGY